MWARRDVLRLGLASAVLSLGAGGDAAGPGFRRSVRAPTYFVFVHLYGGMDAILTTNPRTRDSIESNVDLPYPVGGITSSGNTLFGPALAPLQPFARDMVVVNGVQVRTVGHQPGTDQFVRLRLGSQGTLPSVFDILAAHRTTQPLGTITWYGGRSIEYTSSAFDGWLFDQLDGRRPADLELLAKTFRRDADRALQGQGGSGAHDRMAAESLRASARLMEVLPSVPKFQGTHVTDDGAAQRLHEQFQRTVWALQNDITKCVAIVDEGWDSHQHNLGNQNRCAGRMFPALAAFLRRLQNTKNQYGRLSDQTLVFVGSELGRFPVLNSEQGKHHLPEAPYMLFSPYLHADGKGAYGATGRHMESLSIDLRTGREAGVGGTFLDIEDMGTTILHVAGIDPKVYGYSGRVLPFLV
jgi:hypothetical protein